MDQGDAVLEEWVWGHAYEGGYILLYTHGFAMAYLVHDILVLLGMALILILYGSRNGNACTDTFHLL